MKISPEKDASPVLPRYAMLAEALWRRVLSGVYPVGSRLPTEKELAQEFDAAVMTVRQGVGLLVQRGIVERQQGKGTFVKQRSATLAIVFGPNVADETAHYYRALLREVEGCAYERQWVCRHYDRINEIANRPEIARKQKETLIMDHQRTPFSGFIEIAPPADRLSSHPEFSSVPMASMTSANNNCDVGIDQFHFGREAVNILASRGCKKIFYFRTLCALDNMDQIIEGFKEGAKEAGVSLPHTHTVDTSGFEGYAFEKANFDAFSELLRYWCSPAGKSEMPDALIFNDDIVMRSVAPALIQARLTDPKKLKVLIQGNKGLRFHYGFPVIRYEISPKWIAERLLDIVERRMHNSSEHILPVVHRGTVFFEE